MKINFLAIITVVIVAIYNDFTTSYCSVFEITQPQSEYYFFSSNTDSYNSSNQRYTLFQITNCGSYGEPLNSSSVFSLWNLQTEGYIQLSSLGSNNFVFSMTGTNSVHATLFQMDGAPFRVWETFCLTLAEPSYQNPTGPGSGAPTGAGIPTCPTCNGGYPSGPGDPNSSGGGPNPCAASGSGGPCAPAPAGCTYCPGGAASGPGSAQTYYLSVYYNGFMTYSTSQSYCSPLWMTPVPYNEIAYSVNLPGPSQFPTPIPNEYLNGYTAGSQSPYYT
jgi:hypothetical protein